MARDRSLYRALTALAVVLLIAAAVCAAAAVTPSVWLPLALIGIAAGVGSGHYRFRLLVERTQRSTEALAQRFDLALNERSAQVLAAVKKSASRTQQDHAREHAAVLAKLESLTAAATSTTADLQVTRRDLADARRELAGVESVLSARILQAARPMPPLAGSSVTEPSGTEPSGTEPAAHPGVPPASGESRRHC